MNRYTWVISRDEDIYIYRREMGVLAILDIIQKKTGSLMPEQRRRRRRGGGGDGYVWRKILSIRGSRRIVFFFKGLGVQREGSRAGDVPRTDG